MSDAPPPPSTRVDALRARYVAGSPFREDRALADELMAECLPVVDALTHGAASAPAAPTHEAMAMLTLLGRRAGTIGATPTAAYTLFDALLEESGFSHVAGDPHGHHRLISLALEGFYAGREERLVANGHQLAREAIPLVELAPRVHALFIYGRHQPEDIAATVDVFGAQLLHKDAASAFVDATGFQAPTHETASEIFAADASARMLGVPCVFAINADLLELLANVSVDASLLHTESDATSGLRRALELAGIKIHEKRSLLGPIRRALDPKG